LLAGAAALLLLSSGLGLGMRQPGFQGWLIRVLDERLWDGNGSGLAAGSMELKPFQGAVQFHEVVVRGTAADQLELSLHLPSLFHAPHLGRVLLVTAASAPQAEPPAPQPKAGPRPPAVKPAGPSTPGLPREPERRQAPAPEAPPAPVPIPVPIPVPGPEPLEQREFMLFTVKLGDRVVAENFPGYPLGGKSYLLPLGEFCTAISLGVKVDRAAAQARGFIISEDRKFLLDLGKGQVEADGKRIPLDRARVEWIEHDLYVDDGYLPRWFPLTLDINPRTAIIQVDPLERLPIQAAWEREAFLDMRKPDPSEIHAKFPLLGAPYALWDWPFLDQTLDFSSLPSAAPGSPKTEVNGSTLLAGDLAFMSAKLFFTSRSGELFGNQRGTLYRKDPNAGLLGPLRARVVELGDFFVPGPSLVGGGPEGRGIHVGNFPERLQSAPDRHSLQGDLLPDWSVELYQNDALVDYQESRPDGQYEFLNIPLRYGVNDLRLVFHGPEGQRREEHRRLDISQSQTPDKTFLYNLAGSRPGDGSVNYQLETAYGISKQLDVRASTVQLGVATPPGSPDRQALKRYTTASVEGYWPGFSTWVGAAQDESGGSVKSGVLNTGWGWTSLSLHRSFLASGFYSPEFSPNYGLITDRTEGQLNFALPGTSWFRVPMQLYLDEAWDNLEGGGRNQSTSARFSFSNQGYYFSNQISRNRVTQPAGTVEDREGILLVSKSFRNFSVRGDVGYQLDGLRPSAQSVALQMDTQKFRPWSFTGGITRDLATVDTQYNVSALRQEGPVWMRLNAAYSALTKFYVGIGFRLSVGREPRTGRWVTSATPMAADGAVSGLAFVDGKGTGARDPGEPAAEGAGLAVDGIPRPGFHPGDGVVFQPYLAADEETFVSLDEGSLEDPFLKPTISGYRIIPRAGKVIPLDFPLAMGGEITGTAQIMKPGGAADLPGLHLELVDPDGKVRIRVISAFDGFFDLAELPPGRYILRVAPGEAVRLGVDLPPAETFDIGPDGTVIDGIRIVVTPRAPLPPEPKP
jgi:hypothetical protein